jgi:hypothetical protein
VWFLMRRKERETHKDEDGVDGREIRRVGRVLNHKVVQWLYRQSQLQSKNSNQEQKKRKETEQEQRQYDARFQNVKRDVGFLSPVS